ncbi:SHOCT domain-containing protein [Gordonia malaquae]|uniref:SHOCT domain-containing protein n=1 Tax=Gordonia malaquae TaxID=410332 RepID=UPI00301AB445
MMTSYSGDHMGTFGHGWMLLATIAIGVVAMVGIALAIRSSIRSSSAQDPESILGQRLVRGEISDLEYTRMVRLIRDDPHGPPNW